jgi:hypothetical protein
VIDRAYSLFNDHWELACASACLGRSPGRPVHAERESMVRARGSSRALTVGRAGTHWKSIPRMIEPGSGSAVISGEYMPTKPTRSHALQKVKVPKVKARRDSGGYSARSAGRMTKVRNPAAPSVDELDWSGRMSRSSSAKIFLLASRAGGRTISCGWPWCPSSPATRAQDVFLAAL